MQEEENQKASRALNRYNLKHKYSGTCSHQSAMNGARSAVCTGALSGIKLPDDDDEPDEDAFQTPIAMMTPLTQDQITELTDQLKKISERAGHHMPRVLSELAANHPYDLANLHGKVKFGAYPSYSWADLSRYSAHRVSNADAVVQQLQNPSIQETEPGLYAENSEDLEWEHEPGWDHVLPSEAN